MHLNLTSSMDQVEDDNATLFKRLLVVVSEPGAAGQIRDTLDLHLYDVTLVSTGAEAVRAMIKESFDALICDFTIANFPAEMFTLAVRRVRPDLCRKIIAITNSAQTTKTVRNLSTISIWKPIDTQILLEAVETVLKKADKTKSPTSQAA